MNKKTLLAALVFSTAAGTLQTANASDTTDKRWYIAPFGTFAWLDSNRFNRESDSGWGGGLSIGKMIDEHFNIEIKGMFQNATDTNKHMGVSRWESQSATADVQYFFSRSAFSPYAVLGIGGMTTNANINFYADFKGKRPGPVSGTSFILEPGVGFTYELSDNFLIRSDVRYRYNNSETLYPKYPKTFNEFNDLVINLGFVIPFGAKPTATPVAFSAPVAAPAPVTPKAVDCSTLDDDADGVNNCVDKCPSTLSGSKVDFNGCPISLELKGVNFKVDSAELTLNAKSILDGVATSLMAYPEKDTIEVHGHTSSEGSNAHNLKLSQRRSQSVVDYLASKGVSNHMIARGFGESKPVADNRTEIGRSMNRRVELIWTGK